MELTVTLKELLDKRGITQRDLAEMTGLTTTAISEIATNRRTSINRAHLTKILTTLEITDMNEVFTIR